MKKVCVVSHDAGGAEIVSNWVKKHMHLYDFNFFIEGPAKQVFSKNLNCEIEILSSLENQIQNCEMLLCGTSWQSSLEKDAMALGRLSTAKVVTILDHWINYKERFLNQKLELLIPDEIWVCDDDAYKIATNVFKNEKDLKLFQIENPYIEAIKKQLLELTITDKNGTNENILYVCEPTKVLAKLQYGDENAHGFTEESALNYFLVNVEKIRSNDRKIIVRPHPSETVEKYAWVENLGIANIVVCKEKSLFEEILSSSLVVGCESMAMVIALEVGKRVVCSIPPKGRKCLLPHKSIETLNSLIG